MKENFFIDDKFYNETVDYIEDNDYDKEEIEKLPDDWKVAIRLSNYEPIFQFTMDWLVERIVRETDYFEDRFPEDSEVVDTQIENAIRQSVDLEKLKDFYVKYFGCKVSEKYENKSKQFSSYFLSFSSGCRIELMKRGQGLRRNQCINSGND